MRTLPACILLLCCWMTDPAGAGTYPCTPTPPDAQGPFYRADAPLRNAIGSGYLLFGEVKSAADCTPIPGAKLELWTTGADGRYDERWRATLFADQNGRYHFETHPPGAYGSRPPHIHLIVSAPGFAELVTQHYPVAGSAMALFELVLLPDR